MLGNEGTQFAVRLGGRSRLGEVLVFDGAVVAATPTRSLRVAAPLPRLSQVADGASAIRWSRAQGTWSQTHSTPLGSAQSTG